MNSIKIDLRHIYNFAGEQDVKGLENEIKTHLAALENKTGKGNDFLGWMHLPSSITDAELADIENTARLFKQNCEVVVVIGIGGSYLGAKAVIEALSDSFAQLKKHDSPLVLFAGQNISEDYAAELIELLNDKSYGIIVISKSGTTTEPAIGFRLLKAHIEKKYGKEEARKRIVAVTDQSRGALKQLSNTEGYKTYVISDDVGGRYSVLTPVGLLPIAVAGFDIRNFVKGAVDMEKMSENTNFNDNICSQYAAARNILLRKNKTVEILVNYHPKLHYISEWWKQLYGESEGKENKGIFPASVDFTSDLHSMGQYIQEGLRNIFETVISIEKPAKHLTIPNDPDDLDKLNFISGKRIDEVNKMAELGTMLAHIDGGVPNIKISLPELNEYYVGQLLYFFEKACAISGYLLGVNPFDQPGVEAYKKNMFALLGKPGFEKETQTLRERLGK